MITSRWRKTGRRPSESGQALAFLVFAFAFVLLGAAAFSVDMGNLWFHRQATQNAADAACTAGAMDLLVDAQGGATGHQGFTNGTAFNCTTTSTAAPCQYAAKNGYNSDGTGNQVSVSFPGSVPGVPSTAVPPTGLAPNAFMRVDVTDNVQTYFSGLLSGSRTQTVRAFAVCGVVLVNSPIPLLVLSPTASGALTIQNSAPLKVFGGPQKSVQVNSNSTSAVVATGGGGAKVIDLTKGGPNTTGSDLGTFGGPLTPMSEFTTGTSGHWLAPAAPVADPLAQLPAPAVPTHAGTITHVAKGTNGCPSNLGCDEYSPGYYPSGINVQSPMTAIFDPGIYYIKSGGGNGFQTSTNGSAKELCLRPSTAVGDGSGGTMFYLADGGTDGPLKLESNIGSTCPATFSTQSGTGSIPYGVNCTAGEVAPANLPANFVGDVLLAPCQAPTVGPLCAPNCSINYGDPLGTANPGGEQRGVLFFQNRATVAKDSISPGNAGLYGGILYFHNCNGSGTGTNCSSSAYKTQIYLGGNPSATTFILNQVIADLMRMEGADGMTFDLNPNSSYATLKASLLR